MLVDAREIIKAGPTARTLISPAAFIVIDHDVFRMTIKHTRDIVDVQLSAPRCAVSIFKMLQQCGELSELLRAPRAGQVRREVS